MKLFDRLFKRNGNNGRLDYRKVIIKLDRQEKEIQYNINTFAQKTIEFKRAMEEITPRACGKESV